MAKARPTRPGPGSDPGAGPRPAQRQVSCYHCGKAFDVSARAMTVGCPACGKQLLVDDVVVKTTQQVRKLQTCGRIIVHPKARVVADLVEAHEGIEVKGSVQTKAYHGGEVVIRAKAKWSGDCATSRVVVEDGAKGVSGFFRVGPDAPRSAATDGTKA